MRPIAYRQKTSEHGYTLVEVLIAALVLSIGILGLAGLQITSTRLGVDSQIQTLSSFSADDVINNIRMRTTLLPLDPQPQNPDVRTKGDEVRALVATAPATNCNPAEAGFDFVLACWNQRLGRSLPQGSGRLIDTNDGTGAVIIRISWFDRATQAMRNADWRIRFY